MKVIFAIIADSAELDGLGKLNIRGSFNMIYAAAFPAVHQELALVLRMEIPSHEYDKDRTIRIAVVGPAGKEIFYIEGKIGKVEPPPGLSAPPFVMGDQIVSVKGLVFPEPGDYAFHVMVNGDTKQTVPLTVAKMEIKT